MPSFGQACSITIPMNINPQWKIALKAILCLKFSRWRILIAMAVRRNIRDAVVTKNSYGKSISIRVEAGYLASHNFKSNWSLIFAVRFWSCEKWSQVKNNSILALVNERGKNLMTLYAVTVYNGNNHWIKLHLSHIHIINHLLYCALTYYQLLIILRTYFLSDCSVINEFIS